MFNKVFACLSIFGVLQSVIYGAPETGDHTHEHVFLGEYATNVLNMKPAELEDMLYWLVEQRIDRDNDMKINLDELKHWMQHIYHHDLDNNIMHAFFECNKKKDHDITFKEYRSCLARKPGTATPTEKTENRLVARWRQADQDGDSRLSLNEFGPFYAPDEMHHQHMHGLLVDEYIDDRDADGDYILSFEEYISQSVELKDLNTGDDWELSLNERFSKIDENKDSKLSHPEVENYLFPPHYDYDPAHEEAVHIMTETDDDKDNKISHYEMMKHLRVFVGSQVLQQGKLLLRSRDEL
ncbi:reticulocalbin-1-like [Bolinopsis microptera]|uniref:reticulocalbin-1-like n=1 Tax=Bolinopsis microptera TaxID=2820187 RepID=UPI00307A2D1A